MLFSTDANALLEEPRVGSATVMSSILYHLPIQDDLHIVDDFDLSQPLEQNARELLQEALDAAEQNEDEDPLSSAARSRIYHRTKAMNESAQYVRQLVDDRRWGPSVLFVTE